MKMRGILICALFFSYQLSAQNLWQELLAPSMDPFTLGVSSLGNVYINMEGYLLRSTDRGSSWEDISPEPPSIIAFGTSPTGTIYTINYTLRKSTDEGNTWIELDLPIPAYYFIYWQNTIMTNQDGDVFIQMDNPNKDTYRSTDEGISWVTIGADSSRMFDIIFKDNLCFAIFNKTGSLGGNLFKSSNNGDTWEIISTAPANLYTLFAAKNGKLYAGRLSGGNPPGDLFISSDNGNNWEAVSEFNTRQAYDIQENKLGHIFIATAYGIYRSTDDGISWHHYNTGLLHTPSIRLAVDSEGYVYVGTGLYGRLYRSIQSTIPVELVSFSAKQIEDEVHLNWQTAAEINNQGFEIERKIENSDWRTIGFKEGFGTITEPQHYSFIDENISSGKYQYRLKQIDYDGTFEYSEIVEVDVLVINNFSLQQNYPNPFNPITTIKYDIPGKSFVTLIVYDVLGNEIEILVKKEKPAGEYEVEFSGDGLSSGIYYYKLQAGNFSSTKKMILLK